MTSGIVMKRKLLVSALLFIAMLALFTLSSAATDPIVTTMEITPEALSEPGNVTVTITVSNSGETDMTEPLTLFDPTSQVVTDFGDNGSATLKAGEVKTWTGTWSVNQRTLENGQLVFFVKYTIEEEDGTTKTQSQPIRGTIEKSNYTAKVTVSRTITPELAREGQTVNVIYNIVNEGTVSLTNLVLHENKDIVADALPIAPELKEGEAVKAKIPVVMGKEDLTSGGTLTYTIADGTQEQTYVIEDQVITYGEPQIVATLTSDLKGVLMNGIIKLTLVIENIGNVDYTDVRITDPILGDVFTNQTLPAGEKLTLEKEITLTQSTDFMFEILAIDKTGTEVSYYSNALSLIAVDPDNALDLELVLVSNKTEVYSDREVVRFTGTIENISDVDANDVVVYQANTEIASFETIPAGVTKTFSRDVTLSMAGQYQISVTATDALDNTMTFESNILQIAFLAPTAVPITPDPNVTATPVPTFNKATYPSISDPDIGTLPKLIRTLFYPLIYVGAGLFIIALALLIFVTIKRASLRRESQNALDHLERSTHRDYAAPADQKEHKPEPVEDDEEPVPVRTDSEDEVITDDELPHMKYVRNAYQIAGKEPTQKKDPYAYSQDDKPEYSDDKQALTPDEANDPNDEESPYRRRSDRVSPYARQAEDTYQEQDQDTTADDYTDDEQTPAPDEAYDPNDEESPYRRRSDRVSPYARQAEDTYQEQDQDTMPDDYTDDEQTLTPDEAYDPNDEESPYRRRPNRVSPYARQEEDTYPDQDTDPDDDTEDP